jgi:hypothetical protein
MPLTLTDSSVFSPVAVPTGGEARTAASVQTPFQALANRTYYLQQLAEVLGVPRLKAVADVPSLKALTLTGITDGDLRYVPSSGIYRYTAASAAAESLPFIASPNSGSGRWIHILNDIAGANSGLATLTAAGRAAQMPANAIVATGYVGALSSRVTSSSTYGDIAGASISLPGLLVGDIVRVDGVVQLYSAAMANSYARVLVSENGGAYTAVTESVVYGGQAANLVAVTIAPICCDRTVGTSGTYTIQVQSKAADGSTASSAQIMSLRATVVRP